MSALSFIKIGPEPPAGLNGQDKNMHGTSMNDNKKKQGTYEDDTRIVLQRYRLSEHPMVKSILVDYKKK